MIEHILDTRRRTVTCRATGRMSFAEACTALRFLVVTARDYKVARTLILLGDASAFVTANDMLILAPIVDACADVLRKGRWAIVVPNSVTFALVGIAFQELRLDGPHLACFRHEQDAVSWLEEQPQPHVA
jgi:hypothetical protein